MPSVADRVAETTTTTGTGDITLGGAKVGYRSFGTAFGSSSSVYYCITNGVDWEVGVGTFTAAGQTLTRSPFTSSNSNALVNFGAGMKDVFCTAPMQTIAGAPNTKAGFSTNSTIDSTHNGLFIGCSNNITVTLPSSSSLGSGFNFRLYSEDELFNVIVSSTSPIDLSLDPIRLKYGVVTWFVALGSSWITLNTNSFPITTTVNSSALLYSNATFGGF